MSALWAALIAAGAAILSSALTSWLTNYLERRRRRIEHELKWLEERFTPALNLLGRLSAVISAVPSPREERKQMADKIKSIVVGQTKENNAWTIAILLDPEETGLSSMVFSAMAYARIAESKDAFTKYWLGVHWGLKELAQEFRRERQAIVSGKSLQSLIEERKDELEKRTDKAIIALNALRIFSAGEAELSSVLQQVERSGVKGAELNWMFDLVSRASDSEGRDRLGELRKACRECGWLSSNRIPLGKTGICSENSSAG